MLKKTLNVTIAFLICAMAFATAALAESDNYEKIKAIISGQQDLLVLATINEKGASAYEVEIIHEIGSVSEEESSEQVQSGETSSEASQKDIFVEGFNSYMYYDNYDYQPKKGDNVLLSLTFNGNAYSVKNGAFKVDYADIDNFKFVIPDGVGSDVIAELSALYIYVESEGKRGDIFVEDNKIYGYNTDGRQEEIIGQYGLKFIDEFGDTTENTATDLPDSDTHAGYNSNAWIKALGIIMFGLFAGGFVGFLVIKIEKRKS